MTSLFVLLMVGLMGTADARPHKGHHHKAHVKQHAVVHHAPHHKPRHAHVYRHAGYRYYSHAGLVWRWIPGHWLAGRWARGHWEFSYRI